MNNRIELAEHFAELGFTKGVEVGVADGRYSDILMQKIPNLNLVGIDPYRVYANYHDYRRESTLNRALKQAHERLLKYDKYIFILAHSVDAVNFFADESCDFVFIDANHKYEFIKQDLEIWTPKVRKGGIVSGHDFYEFKTGGVKQAVEEYTQEHGYNRQKTKWGHNENVDDKVPDWWFVK